MPRPGPARTVFDEARAPVVSTRVSTPLRLDLDRIAVATAQPRSSVIREALRAHVKAHGLTAA